MGTSASYAYDIGGNPYKMQDGDGMTISLATGAGTGGTLPALLTPNSNSNLATSFAYTPSFALTQVTGANGATTGETYDAYGRRRASPPPMAAAPVSAILTRPIRRPPRSLPRPPVRRPPAAPRALLR